MFPEFTQDKERCVNSAKCPGDSEKKKKNAISKFEMWVYPPLHP